MVSNKNQFLPKPDLSKPAFSIFKKEAKSISSNKCPFCGEVIYLNGFKDELSKKEYGISGLCQKCQDEVFSPEGDTE